MNSIKELEIEKLKSIKKKQETCTHLMNSTGVCREIEQYAFHCLKIGDEIIGVCPYCQLKISSLNPDHLMYFKYIDSVAVAEMGKEVPMSEDEQWIAAKEIYYNNLQNVYVFWQHWGHALNVREDKILWSNHLR